MFDRPLFQDDIWEHIIAFNKFYFTARTWWVWMLFVFVVLAFFFFLLRKSLRSRDVYQSYFVPESYPFEWTKQNIFALLCLVFSLIITAVYMYSLENSLFENFDLMAINTTQIMLKGLLPCFDSFRIAPLSHWYLNFLYAITQNIFMIKAFVLCQLSLLSFLLYLLFDFIPPARRLCFLSVFLLTPTMFQTSNIIFIERSLLGYIALSLIFARLYCKNGKLRWVALFLLFLNISIYTKETALLFYSGFLLTSLFYNIWNAKITLFSFFHPIKTIKSLPIEFLVGLSLFLYAILYFLMMSITFTYKTNNFIPFITLLSIYKLELFLTLISGAFLLVSALRCLDFPKNPLFSISSFWCGGFCVLIGLVFVLKLSAISPHLYGKSYYLLLSLLFSLAYLTKKIKNCFLFFFGILLLLSFSFYQNKLFYSREEGKYYRAAAEFFAQNLSEKNPETLFVVEKEFSSNPLQNTWLMEVWSSAYKYYFRHYNLTFKFYHPLFRAKDFWPLLTIQEFHHYTIWPAPEAGDWLVINKQAQEDVLERYAKYRVEKPAFENKLFEIYKVK